MRHLRADYDAIQAYPTKREHYLRVDGEVQHFNVGDELPEGAQYGPIIPDDEPVFLLRAQDPAAAEAVREWCRQHEMGEDPDYELTARVWDWADEMEAFAAAKAHGPATVPAELLR